MQKLNEPILPGTAATDYERYLRTDELLSLQKAPSAMVHRDELLFQTVHQSSELWLKLASQELEDATALIDADRTHAAVRLLRRANDCLSLTTENLHMLDHLSPADYAIVRTALGHGAGFDSPGFRSVHRVSPAIGDAFQRLLRRRALTTLDVYDRSQDLEDLYQLAEQLITWDERVILWRFHHLKVVERIIGGRVVGTQGTPVEVLERRVDVRFFPDLWEVRNDITRRSPLGVDGHGGR
ncbi:MAG TPA: tryptophan 2,3-dioxygenase family protein [Vicinamibacterales bacterium]|jgi:tryptophan 2,3-dioxygenase|nr:tryptophan 2,3-dioxygenase family protein [Vicinamibacterales bacterium]